MQMIFPAARETEETTPRRLNSRTASRAQRNWPVRLTEMTLFHCASVISSKRASLWSPALLTRMSTVPKCSMARRNMSETSDPADTCAMDANRAPNPIPRRNHEYARWNPDPSPPGRRRRLRPERSHRDDRNQRPALRPRAHLRALRHVEVQRGGSSRHQAARVEQPVHELAVRVPERSARLEPNR